MSAMAPIRSAAGRNLTVTRSPVASWSGPPRVDHMEQGGVGTVQADQRPGERGRSGCLGSGCATHAQDSTTPPGPTSTMLAGVVAGGRVVLGRGHDDRPAGPPDAQQPSRPAGRSGRRR